MTISITTSNTLNVMDKYENLVRTSLSSNSVYARVKETVEALKDEGAISDAKKAEIITAVIGNAVSSITSSSMSTALQWAAKEKEIELQKIEMSYKLAAVKQDTLTKVQQTKLEQYQYIKAQAEVLRMYGTPTVDSSGNVQNLSDEGKVYSDTQLTLKQKDKLQADITAIKANTEQTKANTHKLVADTITNYGYWTYSFNDVSGGISTAVRHNIVGVDILSDLQVTIAKEQANGYVYNAWANAVNSSSSMIGTALTANIDIFTNGSSGAGDALLSHVKGITSRLDQVTVPYPSV